LQRTALGKSIEKALGPFVFWSSLCDFDAHRPLRAEEILELVMTWRESRKVTKSLTVQCDRVMYLPGAPQAD
jgi:hypothetical protein